MPNQTSLPVCLELCMKSSKRPLTSKEISFLRFLFPRANPSYNQLYAHFELHQLFPTFNQNYEQSSARGQAINDDAILADVTINTILSHAL